MDALAALTQANQEMESRLRQITEEHWDAQTPCSEWDVRALTNHLLLGTRMAVQLLGGMSQQEVVAQLGDDMVSESADPIADLIDLAGQMYAGFAGPGGLEGTVDHPMGQIPRSTFIGFRVMDNATHAWDLARAIGADETLDPDLVSWMWNDIQPMAGGLGELGIFGESASGDVGEDAPLQTRYLDLVGRRP